KSFLKGFIMADQMYVVITLRKPVPDAEVARALYLIVKERMEDKPEVEVRGHCANHFDLDEE
ncbi:unnamed protein product, partial [marine sediment metagenome]